MSDIFQEVDEALQKEKWEKLWQQHSLLIIGAAVSLVLGVAAFTGFQSWNTARNEAETARLIQALDTQDPASALKTALDSTRPGQEAAALLISAGLAAEKADYETAAALYKQTAETRHAPKDLRDLARLMYVRSVQMTAGKDGQAEPGPLNNMLEPVLKNEDSPFIWHARIEAALLYAHSGEDYEQAIFYLAPFEKTKDIPFSLKQRAQALLNLYTLKLENNGKESQNQGTKDQG